MAATEAASEQRIEIVGERRRPYNAEFRARLVAASLLPEACVRDLARQHGVCPSLIYRWRRLVPKVTAPTSDVRPGARQTTSGRPPNAPPLPGFVSIGVIGRAADGGSALVASGTVPAAATSPSPGGMAPAHPAWEERPGVIAVELADGTRLRLDAFVDEGALRRVVAALRVVP